MKNFTKGKKNYIYKFVIVIVLLWEKKKSQDPNSLCQKEKSKLNTESCKKLLAFVPKLIATDKRSDISIGRYSVFTLCKVPIY